MGYIFKKPTVNDVKTLKDIHESWEQYVEIHGENLENDYFYRCVTEGDLPPIKNASKENYYIYLIENKNKTVGFIEMYAGYPTKEDLWISLFEIHKDYRGLGHGKDIFIQLEKDISKYGCKNLGLAVDLKNFRGMKFWTNLGFKEIIAVSGDSVYGVDKFARIALRKRINSFGI